jgi:hypothetical protein
LLPKPFGQALPSLGIAMLSYQMPWQYQVWGEGFSIFYNEEILLIP